MYHIDITKVIAMLIKGPNKSYTSRYSSRTLVTFYDYSILNIYQATDHT